MTTQPRRLAGRTVNRVFRMLRAVLPLALLGACQTVHPDWGTGPVTVSPGIQQMLNHYMKTQSAMAFAITVDGRQGGFSYCMFEHGLACENSYEGALDACRRLAKGRIECKILADLHDIVWQGPVKMATTEQMMLVAKSKKAKFCYDSLSKSYYAIAGNCMVEDEPATKAAYTAYLKAALPVYCRKGADGPYYQGKGGCMAGDATATKAAFQRSRRFCKSADGRRYYEAAGPCRDGDIRIGRTEFLHETTDTIR